MDISREDCRTQRTIEMEEGSAYHWCQDHFVISSQPILLCRRTRSPDDKVIQLQRHITLHAQNHEGDERIALILILLSRNSIKGETTPLTSAEGSQSGGRTDKKQTIPREESLFWISSLPRRSSHTIGSGLDLGTGNRSFPTKHTGIP